MTHQSTANLTEAQCFNILESIDLPIDIKDAQGILFYRNSAWERLFGYTGAESLGKPILELVVEPCDVMIAQDITQQMYNEGKCWTGEFPVRNKQGDRFVCFATNKALVDENGAPVGIISMVAASRPSQPPPTPPAAPCKPQIIIMPSPHHPQPPLQSAVASKISKLAAKVKYWEIKKEEKQIIYDHERGNKSGRGENRTRPSANSNNRAKAADEWMIKHGMPWPWKGNERVGYCFISETGLFCGQWLRSSDSTTTTTSIHHPAGTANVQPASRWSSFDIKWEDLIIKERIINGRGSCGSVYHAVWYGSDVALKLFSKQECSHDHLIQSFWQEVSLMKRLRHPNILLFMGAVLSPHHLCIVTEFLRRGSLFQLLHRRNRVKLNWRHRVHMAMDIARGMNHLHHCLPPIIHCDLTSSNILVDNNWTLKVGDFGHCRIKHKSFVTRKEGIGTPEWMAPEVLRNEEADEKSDVYSYGVVLWEFTTEKIPWDGLNPLQVIKTVGLMNQRLEIPTDVDPQWASLLERCLCSEPNSRPTFQDILDELKDLQKKFALLQIQASNQASIKMSQG